MKRLLLVGVLCLAGVMSAQAQNSESITSLKKWFKVNQWDSIFVRSTPQRVSVQLAFVAGNDSLKVFFNDDTLATQAWWLIPGQNNVTVPDRRAKWLRVRAAKDSVHAIVTVTRVIQ